LFVCCLFVRFFVFFIVREVTLFARKLVWIGPDARYDAVAFLNAPKLHEHTTNINHTYTNTKCNACFG
jgi:hypothetical protein